MATCKINIGHDRSHVGKTPLTDMFVREILQAESAVWPVWLSDIRHYEGQDERTTVVGLVADDEDTLRGYLEEICSPLEQEAVSVLWGPVWTKPYHGEFVGPEAKKWDQLYGWKPERFLDVDGLPLNAER